jgi:hypothetical protein
MSESVEPVTKKSKASSAGTGKAKKHVATGQATREIFVIDLRGFG